MPTPSPKIHELVRERLHADAVSAGRKLYLSSVVRELRADVRRRRYSALVDDGAHGTVSVRIEYGKDAAQWTCSLDGKSNPNCAHVAALLTAMREREASEGEADASEAGRESARESLVEHLLENAERDHLVQAFRLCLRTYPELQGDLVFTILENIDDDGAFYEVVVALMDDPEASDRYTLPEDGFDPYRLLDEINYLYEQGRYEQAFLLSRAILARTLSKMAAGKRMTDHETDLTIASSGLLSDLSLPPAPEHLADQVHGLGMRLLRRYPKLEPQIQSSLIALIDEEALNEHEVQDLEGALRRRWERARRSGKAAQRQAADAEQFAMPLALFYARTRQFDKLETLFTRHLQNPLLRAPALAEMLQHQLHEVVLTYVDEALVRPAESTTLDDAEDGARCAMYNDLVMMLCEMTEDEAAKRKLVLKAFLSIGHRVYSLLDYYRELVGDGTYAQTLETLLPELEPAGLRGGYPGATQYFVVLCEAGLTDIAYEVYRRVGSIDPIVLLDYLGDFLPEHGEEVFEEALSAVVGLFPLSAEPSVKDIAKSTIMQLYELNEERIKEALDQHFVDIADDELADFVDVLLGDLSAGELGL